MPRRDRLHPVEQSRHDDSPMRPVNPRQPMRPVNPRQPMRPVDTGGPRHSPTPINVPPGPTWVLASIDNPAGMPVVGQFDPNIQESRGAPIWEKKPAIAGGQPWLKYIGKEVHEISFEFTGMATTILDGYPEAAWARINQLADVDDVLGRPHRVVFTYGPTVIQGFITDVPAAQLIFWGGSHVIRSRKVRQIGPVRITITRLPDNLAALPKLTSFVTMTEETQFEELAADYYGDARYGQSLAMHNQGRAMEDTLELPRKSAGLVGPSAPVSAYFDDPIEGL